VLKLMYELSDIERLLLLASVLVTISLLRKLTSHISNKMLYFSLRQCFVYAIGIELVSLLCIQSLFFSNDGDWNGWFASKEMLPELTFFDVVYLSFPIYVLTIISGIGVIGGIIVAAYPSFKRYVIQA